MTTSERTVWVVIDEWGSRETFDGLERACVAYAKAVAEAFEDDEDQITLKEQVIRTTVIAKSKGTRPALVPGAHASGPTPMRLVDLLPSGSVKRGGIDYSKPPQPKPEEPWVEAGRKLAEQIRREQE